MPWVVAARMWGRSHSTPRSERQTTRACRKPFACTVDMFSMCGTYVSCMLRIYTRIHKGLCTSARLGARPVAAGMRTTLARIPRLVKMPRPIICLWRPTLANEWKERSLNYGWKWLAACTMHGTRLNYSESLKLESSSEIFVLSCGRSNSLRCCYLVESHSTEGMEFRG